MLHETTTRIVISSFAAIALAACSGDPGETGGNAAPPESAAEVAARAGAPFFEGMGKYHRSITTEDAWAQRYFDQGMVLAFGFNHAESIRSFRAAQRLDPDCAMCFWGEALATGPNINVTANGKAIMTEAEQVAAYAALDKALALKANASQVEADLIDALTLPKPNCRI